MSPPETVGHPRETDSRFLNRELSWLDFNARVLALAEDPELPLLERVKFLAIFSQNLDEFFQVRVAGLMEHVEAGIRTTTPDDLDEIEQLRAIRVRVDDLVTRQARVFTKEVLPELGAAGIGFVDWEALGDDDRQRLSREFTDHIFPVLTPLAVDPAHPFPYISNLSLNLAVVVRNPKTGEERFARVKIPPVLARFVALADQARFVPLEQVIAAHLGSLFPGMEVIDHHPFRVTRDADIELTDESEDLLAAMEIVLRQRTKFGAAVRLEVDSRITPDVLELLIRELELAPQDVYVIDGPLDLGGLWALYGLRRPELKYAHFAPQTPSALGGGEDADVMWAMRHADILVHHPYDSFATSVEAFVAQAAADPHVLAIKQTLYRTGGDEAGIVTSLAKAAEAGKQVVALVELKARFDEQANIERARMLEQAGAHVVYGLVGLKTHAKILLVVRQEADGMRRYCHIGTGNYNPKTATLYEDLGVLSADPDLGADLSELFNHLTGYSRPGEYRRLLVAPTHLRAGLRDMIRSQAHPAGRITLKLNSLVDADLVDDLYAASDAGADIDLIVRGICCLRAGVPGLSERIRVRSIIGRYLEHSRILRFGEPGPDAQYVIGSADLMPRNLDRRVEAMLRVTEPRLQARLDEILDVCLADDVLAWSLRPDGTWHKTATTDGVECQVRFQDLAIARSQTLRVDA